MEINEIQLFKIDLEEENLTVIDSSTYGIELSQYLEELFSIVISGSVGQRFQFSRPTTEVRGQITKINQHSDFAEVSQIIGSRLLNCEFEAQENVARLGITIQKGVLVLALVSDSGVNKFIICKADHNEFLDEVTYRRSSGLPVKKKAFKAFVCNLNDNDLDDEILVYDTNKTDTKYWWSNFLELDKIVKDEDNTERAFKAIDKKVFDHIKRESPLDYTYLRNSTVRYFRSNDRFEMEEYIENAIGDYQPYDSNLNLNVIKNRIRQLPASSRPHFDNQFNIDREKIKARFKNTVKLTDQIDLQIKEDIPENTVLAEIGIDGIKYVKIKSEIGYAFFKNSTNRNNE